MFSWNWKYWWRSVKECGLQWWGDCKTRIGSASRGFIFVYCTIYGVQLKRDGTRCRTGGKVKGKLANGVGSQYSHTTSEHGVSSITTADAHTSAASSRLNWRLLRFKWTRPFRRKTKSGFCVCAITFQTQSTSVPFFRIAVFCLFVAQSVANIFLLLFCAFTNRLYSMAWGYDQSPICKSHSV
jgi:hypothetical protein